MKKILHKGLFFPFILIASMAFMPYQDNNSTVQHVLLETAPNTTVLPKTNFLSGEMLVYKIYYNLNFVWIPAGEVTFKIEDTDNQYHISAIGRTYSSYEWFYKVRDNYHSYVDKTTLLPSISIRDVNEGKYRLYSKVTYDQNAKKAFYQRGNNKDKIEKSGQLNTQDFMHDVLSIIYYCRTLDYDNASVGKEYPVKVLLDEEIYPLRYKYLGKEEKKVRDQGKWSTIKFTPQLVSGNMFKEGDEMKVWASNDDNKIPLMIESPVSVGSIKVVLKSWKGLKYDVKAKIE